MLYKESVEQPTLELLISLQQKSYLKGFHLVGGTALALYIGHRKLIIRNTDYADYTDFHR